MKIERFSTQGCCGKTSIFFKTDQPITKYHLDKFVALGFNESKNFTAAGILYVDNLDFIITIPFGANKIQIRARGKDDSSKLEALEKLIEQM